MTSISKNVYIDKLDNIVNKCNNIYHNTIKINPSDVKSSTYIDISKEINDKDPKFKVADIVKISKYKNIFAKGYVPNWYEEVFVIKKVKNTVPWTLVILKAKKLLEHLPKKNYKKQIKNILFRACDFIIKRITRSFYHLKHFKSFQTFTVIETLIKHSDDVH